MYSNLLLLIGELIDFHRLQIIYSFSDLTENPKIRCPLCDLLILKRWSAQHLSRAHGIVKKRMPDLDKVVESRPLRKCPLCDVERRRIDLHIRSAHKIHKDSTRYKNLIFTHSKQKHIPPTLDTPTVDSPTTSSIPTPSSIIPSLPTISPISTSMIPSIPMATSIIPVPTTTDTQSTLYSISESSLSQDSISTSSNSQNPISNTILSGYFDWLGILSGGCKNNNVKTQNLSTMKRLFKYVPLQDDLANLGSPQYMSRLEEEYITPMLDGKITSKNKAISPKTIYNIINVFKHFCLYRRTSGSN